MWITYKTPRLQLLIPKFFFDRLDSSVPTTPQKVELKVLSVWGKYETLYIFPSKKTSDSYIHLKKSNVSVFCLAHQKKCSRKLFPRSNSRGVAGILIPPTL